MSPKHKLLRLRVCAYCCSCKSALFSDTLVIVTPVQCGDCYDRTSGRINRCLRQARMMELGAEH